MMHFDLMRHHLLLYQLNRIWWIVIDIFDLKELLLVKCILLFFCVLMLMLFHILQSLFYLHLCVQLQIHFLSFLNAKLIFFGTSQAQMDTAWQTYPLAIHHKNLSNH